VNETVVEFPLVGPGGEPIDLWRILYSNGMSELPPMAVDEDSRALDVTLPLNGMRPRSLRIRQGMAGFGLFTVQGNSVGPRILDGLKGGVRHILRLDEDLSGFYEQAAEDPHLQWVTNGAGRMIRSATVFEDVIKTICTTNCAWSATKRMVSALVEHLGERAPGSPQEGPYGRAFPSPETMASVDETFYANVMRAGYRGPYMLEIARTVADGSLDLEALGRMTPDELSDEDLEAELLELPGVGPYASAHIMLTMGRYSRLIFDSWTRPKYANLVGRKTIKDSTMERRFRRYGAYAGLAFWMFLTRDWVED
jgi:N-glycosylase/DNA lyase